MVRKSVLMLILLISVLMVSLPAISEALMVGPSDYTGYRTSDPGDPYYGIYGTAGWGNASGGYLGISWVIDYNISYPMPFMYEYTFDIPVGGEGLSHFIIEVSEDTTTDNFCLDPADELKWNKEQEGNPGMPSDLYGIKTGTSGQTGLQTYKIYSDRAPMWGDFYAKDGVESGTKLKVYAYNLGFGNEPDSSFINNWIPVPDTETMIPEPTTLLLMLLGIICIVGAGLKKKLS